MKTPLVQDKVPRKESRLRNRIFQFAVFTIFSLLIVYFSFNFIFAWTFITSMIKPQCPQHQPIASFPEPGEYWLKTKDGLSIRIWYYPPKNGRVIITLGGLTGSLGNQIPPIVSLLQGGYGILQVDTRACANPAALVTLGANERFDAEAALNFLKIRPEVNQGGIGVMGFSMGGAAAIHLMAHNPEVKALIRDGGYDRLDRLFSPLEGANFQTRFFQTVLAWLFACRTGVDIQTINPLEDLKKIIHRPVLLIYGEMEAESGRVQYEVGGESVELWIVPGGSHGQNHIIAPREYQQRVIRFFDQALSTRLED